MPDIRLMKDISSFSARDLCPADIAKHPTNVRLSIFLKFNCWLLSNASFNNFTSALVSISSFGPALYHSNRSINLQVYLLHFSVQLYLLQGFLVHDLCNVTTRSRFSIAFQTTFLLTPSLTIMLMVLGSASPKYTREGGRS